MQYKCCGAESAMDWWQECPLQYNSTNQLLPETCCNMSQGQDVLCTYNNTAIVYEGVSHPTAALLPHTSNTPISMQLLATLLLKNCLLDESAMLTILDHMAVTKTRNGTGRNTP